MWRDLDQKNLRRKESILFVVDHDMRKRHIMYVGIAWITAFRRVSFRPGDSNRLFQASAFFSILVIRNANVSLLHPPHFVGTPRYLAWQVEELNPRSA
ncbi:unnamed protein product [Linum trigynum]|uniref:Uncharacterized protein n=1 Tax=Linum trigynum TaxID=586398 RepID=A0AAV2EDD2_9ROSI